jgi:hypothetical protein
MPIHQRSNSASAYGNSTDQRQAFDTVSWGEVSDTDQPSMMASDQANTIDDIPSQRELPEESSEVEDSETRVNEALEKILRKD